MVVYCGAELRKGGIQRGRVDQPVCVQCLHRAGSDNRIGRAEVVELLVLRDRCSGVGRDDTVGVGRPHRAAELQ